MTSLCGSDYIRYSTDNQPMTLISFAGYTILLYILELIRIGINKMADVDKHLDYTE